MKHEEESEKVNPRTIYNDFVLPVVVVSMLVTPFTTENSVHEQQKETG